MAEHKAKKEETPVVQQVVASNDDVTNNKTMAILSYLWLLVFIPLLTVKDSPFVKFHVNQGLWLLIISTVLNFVVGLTVILVFLYCITVPAMFVYMILGIINANNGEMKPLPGFASLPALWK